MASASVGSSITARIAFFRRVYIRISNVYNKWRVLTYVLAHDHCGIDGTKGFSHNADLLGGNVVDVDENAFVVLGDGLLACSPDLVLSGLGVRFNWH